MFFSDALYSIIILPIETIIEFVFCFALDKFERFGVSGAIVAVSLAVNFLALPIYNVADALQLKERKLQKNIKNMATHIKKNFKGDEQFMILNTYYRQNNYHPLYALRQSLSIIIEVPFFIAAYHFLSHCSILENQSIFFLKDLSKPDNLLPFSINLLPILMTIINIVSSLIYTKDASMREKIQTNALAVIFLVILYNSPSGLVCYWILNNIFSLIKNILKKLPNPSWIVYAFFCIAFITASLYLLLFKDDKFSQTKCIFYILTIFCILLAFFMKSSKAKNIFSALLKFDSKANKKNCLVLFLLSCFSLTLLTGVYISGSVIVSSPSEFSFLKGDNSPFILIWDSFTRLFGMFFFWPFVIYKMFGKKAEKIMSILFFSIFAVSALNFFVFPGDYGLISQLLIIYDKSKMDASALDLIINLFAIIILICLIVVIAKKKYYLNSIFCLLFTIALGTASFLQCHKINSGYKTALYVKNGTTEKNTEKNINTKIEPTIKISKTGKNVFIIMLDRATGAFLQECFDEDKMLYEQYDGFTFYPNTATFSYCTLAGFPPLYGGYEYTPAMINLRPNDTIVEKQEEAISMLPRLFAKNGYSALMVDMPWIDSYSKNSDFYFMDKYDEKIESVYIGDKYADLWKIENFGEIKNYQYDIDRKLFPLYSIMKIAPIGLRKFLYNSGRYFTTINKEFGIGESYDTTINFYSSLDYMPNMTVLQDEGNTFSFLQNELIHYPNVLQVPEYKPSEKIAKLSESKYSNDLHYYVNMAALKLLGKWFDFLKENKVYDNTRIIISADHGSYDIKDNIKEYSMLTRGDLTCLLLVKDFNSKGKLTVDNSFMTNADVPSIAVKNLIENPINLATGRDFTKFVMKSPAYGEYTDWGDTENHEGNVITVHEGTWYSIKDNIFEKSNWNAPTSEEVYSATKKYMQEYDAP